MRKAKIKLDRIGRAKWKEYEKILSDRESTTLADWDLLESYCVNHQIIQQASLSMANDGLNIVNSAGSIAANPATKLYVSLQKQNVTIAEKIRLTSLAAGKGPSLDSDKYNEFDEF